MQSSDAIPHKWQILYLVVAGFLGWSAKLLHEWYARKKPQAESHEIEARARKTDAEARQIDFQVQQMRGDVLLQYIDRMSTQQLKIDQLSREKDEWKAKAEAESLRADILELELDEIKRAH